MKTNISNVLKALFIGVITFGLSGAMDAQIANYFMENGSIEACEGSFQDDNSGGAEGSPYSDTDYTFTICSDSPGDVVSVLFVAFNLQTSANPNNNDRLAIYDGDSTGANSLGSYTGDDLQGIPVTGTVNNVSGCLTFVFTCNTGNTNSFPGWEALISCTTPCDPPTSASVITDPEPDNVNVQSVGVCLDTPVSFEDDGSFAGAGFTLDQYIWNFDDGTIDTTSGTSVSHAFTEPGEYIVNLSVVDNNGCQSLNLNPLQVLVSTIPVFNTEYPDQICLGGLDELNGNPVQSVTWTALPPQVVAGETYLADGAGFSYSSSLVFDFFDPDQTLDDCDDLYDIFVNMEHSYMGDLQIELECPDGTTVILVEYPNGGGGTFLGEAVDDGTTTPGVGWDYYWDPDATNGTWGDNAGGFGGSLEEGSYESDYDLCNLVGCPLNGEWSFSVIDNLAIDNGYIFEWGINFNPELFPGITTFTPIIGLGPDSTWWEGPNIVETSDDGNIITIEPPALGEYDYTFFATNDFSCTFDTTITIECVMGPGIDAGEDQTLCGDLELNATVIDSDYNLPPCLFTLELFSSNGEFWGWDGASIDVFVDGVLLDNFTSNVGTETYDIELGNGQALSISYIESLWGTTGNNLVIYDDSGAEIYSVEDPAAGEFYNESVSCVGDGQMIFSWEPAEFLSDGSITNPSVEQIPGETEFTITAYPEGFPGCASSDVVNIAPAFNFSIDFQDPSCNGNDGFINVDIDGASGIPPWSIEYYVAGNLDQTIDTDGGIIEFDNLSEGTYSVTVIGQNCEYENEIIINGPQIITTMVSADTTICIGGTATLSAWSDFDDDNSWQYVWDNDLGISQNVNASPSEETTYSVYGIDDFGCETSEVNVLVSFHDSLSIVAPNDVTLCVGEESSLSVIDANGGYGDYNYSWTYLGQSIGSGESIDYSASETLNICVTLSDGCESPISSDCFDFNVEVPVDVQLTSDLTDGCVPAAIDFENLVDQALFVSSAWTLGDGTVVNNLSSFNHLYEEAGSYDVSLTLVSPIGCVYSSNYENYISVYNNPSALFDASPQPTTIPETEIQFVDKSIGGVVEYQWIFNDPNVIGNSTVPNPIFEFPQDVGGIYPVTLIVTDEHGCTNKITLNVTIYDLYNVFVPNSFTPNGDGINDVFFVTGTDIDPNRFEFMIFDRWGEVVYESNDINDVWTGEFQNGEYFVPDGIYSWRVVTHSYSTTERKELVGSVNLMR